MKKKRGGQVLGYLPQINERSRRNKQTRKAPRYLPSCTSPPNKMEIIARFRELVKPFPFLDLFHNRIEDDELGNAPNTTAI